MGRQAGQTAAAEGRIRHTRCDEETTMRMHQFHNRKPSPMPWRLVYQTSSTGKRSRFELLDANGKKVRLSRAANAVLMTRAPEIHDLLIRTIDRLRYFHHIVTSEATHKVEAPEVA